MEDKWSSNDFGDRSTDVIFAFFTCERIVFSTVTSSKIFPNVLKEI